MSKNGQKPPIELIFEWIGISEQIKQHNLFLNTKCKELIELFQENGFQSCILKGQGNSLMYPEPLLRMPGDIDIWVKGSREEILSFCRSKYESSDVRCHHIQLPIWNNVDVEVHFKPTYSWNPRLSKRTNQYFSFF